MRISSFVNGFVYPRNRLGLWINLFFGANSIKISNFIFRGALDGSSPH